MCFLVVSIYDFMRQKSVGKGRGYYRWMKNGSEKKKEKRKKEKEKRKKKKEKKVEGKSLEDSGAKKNGTEWAQFRG